MLNRIIHVILRKINSVNLLSLLILSTLSVSCYAEKTENYQKMTVADYFAHLPDQYITYTGDIGSQQTVVDVKNGYIAKREEHHHDMIWFELVLFRKKGRDAVIVVSNMQSDCACTAYETFFLKYDSNKWQDISKEVLPTVKLASFFDPHSESYHKVLALLKKYPSIINYHYKLPQYNTTIELFLEICDAEVEATFNQAEQEIFWQIIGQEGFKKKLSLQWNKEIGKFEWLPIAENIDPSFKS
jgi:hypothetical protein